MPFHVCVYRRPPVASDSEIDEAANLLLTEPMGTDGLFGEGWDVPSKELGLELLARAYDAGLTVSGTSLDQLADEVDVIDQYWTATNFVDRYFADKSVADRLRQTIQSLRAAIELARAHQGHLIIS
jgi:hypothetical protein